MKIIVSACLTGVNCKYNGTNNFNQKLCNFLKNHQVIKICPEVMGGLKRPHPPAEIISGKVFNKEGKEVSQEFFSGAKKAFEIVEKEKPDLIILQSRSPSCGVNEIYDGTFTGKKIPGHGLFAELCIKSSFKTIDVEDFPKYLEENKLNS